MWQDAKAALARYASNPESKAPGVLENALTTFGQKAVDDPELLAKLDEFAVDVAVFLVSRYQDEVADLIASTVSAWDPELTSRRVELAIGRDLQFIRINGTIVGGLAGMIIYLISSLFPSSARNDLASTNLTRDLRLGESLIVSGSRDAPTLGTFPACKDGVPARHRTSARRPTFADSVQH